MPFEAPRTHTEALLVPSSLMVRDPGVSVLLTADQIRQRVAELATEINTRYPSGRDPHLVAVLKGSVVFLADLMRAIARPVTMDVVAVSSYGGATSSSGAVTLRKDLDTDLADRDVLIVEDIVDTGRTLAWLQERFRRRHPRSLRTVTLLDKPARRTTPLTIDHVGFTIDDHFVVGYGLDFDGRYRELGYVAVLEPPITGSGVAQGGG